MYLVESVTDLRTVAVSWSDLVLARRAWGWSTLEDIKT